MKNNFGNILMKKRFKNIIILHENIYVIYKNIN